MPLPHTAVRRVPPPLSDIHQRGNRRTADLWELYTPHRARITALLARLAPEHGGGRLCVLGAGNANDLDLAALAQKYTEIHLVDLDGEALQRALRRLPAEFAARIVVHDKIDLTGIIDRLDGWARAASSASTLTRAAAAAPTQVAAAVPGRFDVVVSTCVLSQIAWTCFVALGNGPLLVTATDSCAAAHLDLLATLTAPGCNCLLLTDTISGETFPLDELFDEGQGSALLTQLARKGALFSGTSPRLLLPLLNHRQRTGTITDVQLLAPWLWQVTPARTVMVYGIGFRRAAGR
jgi:hypothetical protein